eukprot:765850-Hanusia_phi.AAC.1
MFPTLYRPPQPVHRTWGGVVARGRVSPSGDVTDRVAWLSPVSHGSTAFSESTFPRGISDVDISDPSARPTWTRADIVGALSGRVPMGCGAHRGWG